MFKVKFVFTVGPSILVSFSSKENFTDQMNQARKAMNASPVAIFQFINANAECVYIHMQYFHAAVPVK